jgi:rare lipoprotein A
VIRQNILLIVVCSFLAACSSSEGKMSADNQIPEGLNGGIRKVGNPYKVSGKWYYPKEESAYDEVGVASWYGEQFHGKKTANGEIYNMNALTAAHKTLPLPMNVQVTNLQNERSRPLCW